jgi:hypothetical protein
MSYWIVDGQKLTNEQYEELERQKRAETTDDPSG